MFGIGMPELIVIIVIALVVFGPGKLPDVGKSIGEAIRGFKKAVSEPEKLPPEEPESQTKTEGSSKPN
jgi:sec-independent protein translocase protein TatA